MNFSGMDNLPNQTKIQDDVAIIESYFNCKSSVSVVTMYWLHCLTQEIITKY